MISFLGVALLMATSSLVAQVPDSPQEVRARIETNRRAYRAGEMVGVRVTLYNATAQAISFVQRPPAHQVRLRLYDSKGRQVKPVSSRPSQRMMGSTHMVSLDPGEELTLRWQGSEWSDLRDWGYDPPAPGEYSVVSIPRARGVTPAPENEVALMDEATFIIEK